MNKTDIEWVKNPDGTQGYTWNPITGCLNHTPEGLCLGGLFPCYAWRLANGRLRNRYLANHNYAPFLGEVDYERNKIDPFYPRFWPERLNELLHQTAFGNLPIREPKGIFVVDMGELFGDWIPREWQEDIFEAIRFNKDYRFYLLTKQPQNLIKFSPFPSNCFVGVTVTDNEALIEALSWLRRIEARVKFLSIEPLLARLPDIATAWLCVNQIIIGAQTKPTVYPKIEWVEEIVNAADKAGMPVFLKDNLEPLLHGKEPFVGSIDIFPNEKVYELKLRQEMPV